MKYAMSCLLLALFLPGCESASDLNVHSAMERLFADAEVATDASYQKLVAKPGTQSVAPKDLRKIVVEFPKVSVRGNLNYMAYTCTGRRLVVNWLGNITTRMEADKSLEAFSAAMVDQGYTRIADRGRIEAAMKELASSLQTSPQTKLAFRKTAGSATQFVLVSTSSFEDEYERSGIKFEWAVSKPFNRPVTVAEIMNLDSGSFSVNYLPADFFSDIRDEPVHSWSTGRVARLGLKLSAEKSLIASLENHEFEFNREYEPRDGRIQRTWDRYRDSTHASLTVDPNAGTLEFYCQPPMRKEPRPAGEKRPPRHPSLAIPWSKRPLMRLEELHFATPKLQSTAKHIHDYGTHITRDEWDVAFYADVRYSNNPRYSGYWRCPTTEINGRSRTRAPYRSFHVIYEGEWKDSAEDVLHSVNVGLTWIPTEGIGISLSYYPGRWSGSASVVKRTEHHGDYLDSHKRRDLLLGSYTAAYHIPQSPFTILCNWQNRPSVFERSRQFLELFVSEEQLRDTMLENVERVRTELTTQINDWENVTVDAEPQPTGEAGGATEEVAVPRKLEEPNAHNKQLLMDALTRSLDRRKQWIEQNSPAIFKALCDAVDVGFIKSTSIADEN